MERPRIEAGGQNPNSQTLKSQEGRIETRREVGSKQVPHLQSGKSNGQVIDNKVLIVEYPLCTQTYFAK
jgi:hypothetical protein